MKRFSSLILMVAMLTGIACTTDATDELAINPGGKTVLTVSLDDASRIELGDKIGSNYAVHWSEGDKISINGIASEEAVIDNSNPAVATFSFNGVLKTPYNVVYPAAEAGKVVFASEQSFENGTFSAGATPLYAYSTDGKIALQHLAGVLKIGVTGSATLLKAQISNVGSPISGEFTIDCSTGKVAATEAASEYVRYSFGEGLALSSEVQYIYLAVPAGVYNELYVTLYDNAGGAMKVTVKANDEKPVKAGTVREFSNAIAYEANVTDHIISDYATLCSYAEVATEKGALVVEDITIPADSGWTPIEKLTKTFDGNGYEISGLTAPLCDSVSGGSIVNLKLANVAIVETEKGITGSLARTVANGTVTNCIAQGTLEMNNTTYNEDVIIEEGGTNYAGGANLNIGGMVGRADAVVFSNCTNRVAITITSLCSASTTNTYTTAIAGVVGKVVGGSYLYDCTNDAPILYNATTSPKNYISIAGVSGASSQNNDILVLKNITNTANGTIVMAEGSACAHAMQICGCSGYIFNGQSIIEDLNNYADLTIKGTAGATARISGVCTYLVAKSCPALRLNNHGNIYYYPKFSASAAPYVSGIVDGLMTANEHTLSDCHNYGDIHAKTDIVGGNSYRIGGISGYVVEGGKVIMNNCSNEGDITVENFSKCLYLGGLLGDTNATVALTKCSNKGHLTSKCNNTSSSYDKHYIGGFNAYINSEGASSYDECTNEGDITFDGSVVGQYLALGGFVGATLTKATIDWTDCTNDATISFKGSATKNLYLSGYIGLTNVAGSVANWSNCNNKGSMLITGTGAGVTGYAGFIGAATNVVATWRNCENSATITHSGTNSSGNIFFGGFVGYQPTSGTTNFFGCTNSGDLSLLAKCKQSGRNGGFVGGNYGPVNFTSCLNSGAITTSLTSLAGATNTHPNAGGFIGDVVNKAGDITFVAADETNGITPCKNTGTITLSGDIGSEYYGYAAGFVAAPKTSGCVLSAHDLINEGDIIVKNISSGMWLRAAGLCGCQTANSYFQNCINKGNVTVDNVTIPYIQVGGITGYALAGALYKDTNTNTGNIIVKGNCSFSNTDNTYVGGIIGYTLASISNAVALCNVAGLNLSNVGMITGTPRSESVIATNCKVGGQFANEIDTENSEIDPFYKSINEGNYYNYIYGSGDATEWGESSNYDGCTFISEL